jgi:hypothetical protein
VQSVTIFCVSLETGLVPEHWESFPTTVPSLPFAWHVTVRVCRELLEHVELHADQGPVAHANAHPDVVLTVCWIVGLVEAVQEESGSVAGLPSDSVVAHEAVRVSASALAQLLPTFHPLVVQSALQPV